MNFEIFINYKQLFSLSPTKTTGYLSTLHREGDDVGIIHVHCLPELPSFGLYGITHIQQKWNHSKLDMTGMVLRKSVRLIESFLIDFTLAYINLFQ